MVENQKIQRVPFLHNAELKWCLNALNDCSKPSGQLVLYSASPHRCAHSHNSAGRL